MCIAADLNLVKVGDAIEDLVGMSAVLIAAASWSRHLWILVDGRDGGMTVTGSPRSHWLSSPPRRCASEQKRRTLMEESISASR